MNNSNPYQDRILGLQEQMKSKAVDLVSIAPTANMRYLTGFAPHLDERFCSLLISQESYRFVVPELNADQVETHTGMGVIRWTDTQGPEDALESALSGLGLSTGVVLAADDSMRADYLLRVQDAVLPSSSIPAGNLISKLRLIKSPDEIQSLSQSAALADRAMGVGIEACQPGVSERQVAFQISSYFMENGAQRVDFTIIASGPNGAFPHHEVSNRIMEKGDTIILDIGATFKGYKSDITRVVHLGEPPQEVLDVYSAVLKANQAGRAAVLPGAKASQVDHAARSSLQLDNLDEYFVHRTGHGLGMEGHEPPWITSADETILETGMVFSVEPGVYLPGKFGVRIEDIVTVTEDGCRVLTGFSHELVINE
jgi:Xaa-Pro aminopeptidase